MLKFFLIAKPEIFTNCNEYLCNDKHSSYKIENIVQK